MMVNPFFINSNLVTVPKDIQSFQRFLQTIAYNIGNSYQSWSLIDQIYGCYTKPHHIPNIWAYDYSKQEQDIEFINSECTHVFLMLQDQIRPVEGYNQQIPFEKLTDFLKKINKEIITVGIGCNQYYAWDGQTNSFIVNNELEKDFCAKLNPQLVKFLRFLADKTSVIGVRGSYTQSVFEQLGIHNTQIIGCPSFYEMRENRVLHKKPFKEVQHILLLEPYNIFSSDYSPLTLDFKGLDYDYNIQDEKAFIQVLFDGDATAFSQEEIAYLNQHKYHLFSSIADWKAFASRHDMAFGYRIHGTILALNSGVPCLFTPPDIKGFEMAEFLKIPHDSTLISEKNIEKIYDRIDVDSLNRAYPALYQNYVSFLAKHNVSIKPKNLAGNIRQPSLKLYSGDFGFREPSVFYRWKIRALAHLARGDLRSRCKIKWNFIKNKKQPPPQQSSSTAAKQ